MPKIHIRKYVLNIALLFAATLLTYILWNAALEKAYANLLVFSSNSVLSITGSDTHLTHKEEDGVATFRVHIIIDSQHASYPQKVQTLLLPAVMLIAWQIFTAFYRKRKQVLASAFLILFVFMALQIIFMLLLTAYYTSAVAEYIYDVMLDTFYIIALGIIILDYIRYPFQLKEWFSFKSKEQPHERKQKRSAHNT